MKWTVKLIAETAPGVVTEHDLLTVERPDRLTGWCPLRSSAAASSAPIARISDGLSAGVADRRSAPPAERRPEANSTRWLVGRDERWSAIESLPQRAPDH